MEFANFASLKPITSIFNQKWQHLTAKPKFSHLVDTRNQPYLSNPKKEEEKENPLGLEDSNLMLQFSTYIF